MIHIQSHLKFLSLFGLLMCFSFPALAQEQNSNARVQTPQRVDNNQNRPAETALNQSSDQKSSQQPEEAQQAQSQSAQSQPVQQRSVPNNVFYDSKAVVSDRTQVDRSKVRKVDPRTEPAQKFIVVETNSAASSQESMIVSGNRAIKLGRYASALQIFENLHKKNPRDARILMGLAVSQHKTGFTQSAMKTYEELLEKHPENTEALINLLGIVKEQYPSVALQRLTELWEKYPNNPGVAAQIGITHASVDDFDAALRFLGIAASLEPNNANHYFNTAIVYDRAGDRDEAIKLYEKALEVDSVYGAGRSVPRETIYIRLSRLRGL